MNFKYFLALFLFSAFETHTIDITKEFCQVTQTPDKVCAQLQAFKKELNKLTQRIELIKRENQESIGSIELKDFEDKTQFEDKQVLLDSVQINSKYKTDAGTLLWKFALARCTIGDDRCKGGRVDITQEFCTATQTPDTICAQFQAFRKDVARAVRIDLVRKNDQEDIGYMDLKHFENNEGRIGAIKVDSLKIYPQFQNKGNGSLLLKFALAQCTSTNCPCYLTAQNTWSEEKSTVTYQKLKKFYQNHDLILKSEWPKDDPMTGEFAFYPKKSRN